MHMERVDLINFLYGLNRDAITDISSIKSALFSRNLILKGRHESAHKYQSAGISVTTFNSSYDLH
jgi:hypothetical protein